MPKNSDKKIDMNFQIGFKEVFCLLLMINIGVLNLQGQSMMEWVFLPTGTVSGNCTSSTNCQTNEICYGLVYTPNVSGTITSYTTGFFIDCVSSGNGNPIFSSASCIMTTNNDVTNACTTHDIVLSANSGNSGFTSLTAGQAVTLHQVCFKLLENESINIVEDEAPGLDLSVSIDLNGGGAVSEFPAYTTFQASHNAPCSALAVNLTSFEASKKDENTYLNWITSTETNNDYFSIEWSENGRTFEEIGTLEGAGNSNEEHFYHYYHMQPANGINYYRLKAVEYDGTFKYSGIRSVHFFSKETPIINTYPNPTRDQLFIHFNEQVLREPIRVQVRSIAGQLLLDHFYSNPSNIIKLPLDHLMPGSYLLRVEYENKIQMEHFIKL